MAAQKRSLALDDDRNPPSPSSSSKRCRRITKLLMLRSEMPLMPLDDKCVEKTMKQLHVFMDSHRDLWVATRSFVQAVSNVCFPNEEAVFLRRLVGAAYGNLRRMWTHCQIDSIMISPADFGCTEGKGVLRLRLCRIQDVIDACNARFKNVEVPPTCVEFMRIVPEDIITRMGFALPSDSAVSDKLSDSAPNCAIATLHEPDQPLKLIDLRALEPESFKANSLAAIYAEPSSTEQLWAPLKETALSIFHMLLPQVTSSDIENRNLVFEKVAEMIEDLPEMMNVPFVNAHGEDLKMIRASVREGVMSPGSSELVVLVPLEVCMACAQHILDVHSPCLEDAVLDSLQRHALLNDPSSLLRELGFEKYICDEVDDCTYASDNNSDETSSDCDSSLD